MKKLIVILTCFLGSMYALEPCLQDTALPTHYKYVKVSDQWGVCPGLGSGIRFHNKYHGWNADLAAISYWDGGFSLYGKGHYFYYPKQNHFYVGIGAGVMGGYYSISPIKTFKSPKIDPNFFIKPTLETAVGFEWNTEKRPLFVQLELGASYGTIFLYPTLSFGTGF